MSSVETLINELFDVLEQVKGLFAAKQRAYREYSHRDTLSAMEFNVDQTGELVITAYSDVQIAGVANVWWLRLARRGTAPWQISRWIDLGEDTVTRLPLVSVAGTEPLCDDLPRLASELLDIDAPSIAIGAATRSP